MLTGIVSNLGKDLLKKAFPNVYARSEKFRAISNPQQLVADLKNKSPLIAAVEALHNTVKASNEIATDSLEAQLIQNELLNKISASGLGSAASNGILDWVNKFMPQGLTKALGVGAEVVGGGVAAKKVANMIRGKNGRYMSAKQAAANPATVASGAKPDISKLGRLGRVIQHGDKLMRFSPIMTGALGAFDEYSTSGDIYKSGAIGLGAGAGAWGGAAVGGAIGSVLIPIPVLGTLIGSFAGGWAGSYFGSKVAGGGYDMIAGGPIGGSLQAQTIRYQAGEVLSLKAQEIIISALEIQGLGKSASGYGGGDPGGYSGGPNSVYARGGVQSVDTPTFRRGIGGRATQDGSRSGGGPVGASASRGDVAGRPQLDPGKLADQLPQGKERFFHQQGNVEGVDKRLVDTLKAASKDLPPGYRMEMISGHDARDTGTKNHPGGVAVDVKLYDDKGRLIPHNGNSPGWKYYEQMYKSVQTRGKEMFPGSDYIWGGSWVSGAAGPGDPMHYQIKSNIPGVSKSSGMYDPETGFDKNSGVNQGINFKANAMSKEEREDYVKSVRERMAKEKADTPAPTQDQTTAAPPIPPASQPQPQSQPLGPQSYDVDYSKVLKAVRAKHPVPSWVSDDYIKAQMQERLKKENPSLKFEGNRISGDTVEMTKLRQGIKDNLGEDPSTYMRPVEEQPKVVPVPTPTQSPELQRLRTEREKLRKELKRAKKDVKKKETSDNPEQPQEQGEPVKDTTRSDRAIWNINPQLHEDEHPQ